MNRRHFLKSLAAAGAVQLLPGCFSAKAYRANGKVRLAAVGCGAQAWYDIRQFAKHADICEIVALCDTDIGAPHTLSAQKWEWSGVPTRTASMPSANASNIFRKSWKRGTSG